MYKLIIVEDEEIIRKGLVNTIDWLKMGFIVVGEAEDGEAGLKIIKELEPDLVITDIKMPFLNGLDMIKIAKSTQNFESIILTSYSDFDYAKKAISIGVGDYILKPINEEELFEVVSNIKGKIDDRKLYEDIKCHTERKEKIELTNFKIYIDSKEVNSYVKYAINKIIENYSEKLSIEGLADELGVSPSYLSRKFKKETSYTFLDMLNKYRVQKAVELMMKERDKYRVYEIADIVGFGDYKNFSTVFKKYTKFSPKDFMKANSVIFK
ncbi:MULTISPECIES: response regulator transcription factor [unclassified Clostridium]|uniref:response regulator transcription factor n=1 Tax=unclassified Clostridium TaxID=2614128 RepID=UPI00290A30C4|nr:response regulator [Clostridium sp.]MDU5107465.1 response regulator [Clostridium sp.]